MSKIIQSPVKRWPGTITIAEPLTMPQYMAWLDCNEAAKASDNNQKRPAIFLPGILAVVEKWELANFPVAPTVDTFPASPAISAIKLIAALVGEIWEVVNAEDEPPLA